MPSRIPTKKTQLQTPVANPNNSTSLNASKLQLQQSLLLDNKENESQINLDTPCHKSTPAIRRSIRLDNKNNSSSLNSNSKASKVLKPSTSINLQKTQTSMNDSGSKPNFMKSTSTTRSKRTSPDNGKETSSSFRGRSAMNSTSSSSSTVRTRQVSGQTSEARKRNNSAQNKLQRNMKSAFSPSRKRIGSAARDMEKSSKSPKISRLNRPAATIKKNRARRSITRNLKLPQTTSSSRAISKNTSVIIEENDDEDFSDVEEETCNWRTIFEDLQKTQPKKFSINKYNPASKVKAYTLLLDIMEKRINSANDKFKILSTNLKNDLNRKEMAMTELEEVMKETEDQKLKLEIQKFDFEQKSYNLEQEKLKLEKSLAEVTETRGKLDEEVKMLSAERDEYEKECEKLVKDCGDYQSMLESERKENNDEISKLKSELEEKDSELVKSIKKFKISQEDTEEEFNRKLKKISQKQADQLEDTQTKLTKITQDKEELESELAKTKKKSTSDIQALETIIEEQREKLQTKLEEADSKSQIKLEEAKAKFRTELETAEANFTQQRQIMNSDFREAKLKSQTELEAAESKFNAQRQKMVTEFEARLEEQRVSLQARHETEISSLENSKKEMQKNLDNCHDQIYILRKEKQEVINEKYEQEAEFNKKSNDLVQKKNVLETQNNMMKLENDQEKLRVASAREKEKNDFEHIKMELENKIATQEKVIERLESNLSSKATDLDMAGKNEEELVSNIQQLKMQLDNAKIKSEGTIENKDKVIDKLNVDKDKLESKIDLLNTKIEGLESQVASSHTALLQTKEESGSLDQKLFNTIKKLEMTNQQLEDAKISRRTYELKCRNLNELVCELKGNIRVMIRVRPPLSESEKQTGNKHITYGCNSETGADEISIKNNQGSDVTVSVDKVLQDTIQQADVFGEVEAMIQSSLYGHHICIFAYGQTGSGKTFSMEGPEAQFLNSNTKGLIPRTMEFILQESKTDANMVYNFTANYLEVYIEKVYDLLSDSGEKINVRMDNTDNQFNIDFRPNLNSVTVKTMDDVDNIIRTAHKRRKTAKTAANSRSSRSHSAFILNIEIRNLETGKLKNSSITLIDLAGSECAKDSGCFEGVGLQEAKAINKSLTALSQCIGKVKNRNSHINFRDSELTKILAPSISQSAKIMMIVHLNPAIDQVGQSIYSAKFAELTNATKLGPKKSTKGHNNSALNKSHF